MTNNKKNSYKGFIRSTTNTLTATNHYQINLPPHVWKAKMGWKLNENLKLDIIKMGMDMKLLITKED